MVERRYRVEISAYFVERLDVIERFLSEIDAEAAFDRLIDDLQEQVIPNFSQFLQIGRRYLDHMPGSAEAMTLLARLPVGAADAFREYLHGDYVILYLPSDAEASVHLLAIRHHRELSFNFAMLR